MPLSNASRLADFGTGIGTAGAIIQVDNVNQRLGVGTANPTATLGVAGIVSATAFYGDGSNLDGVASAGLGTALSEEEFNPLTVIYQTSDTLSVGATITVDPPDATTKVAYTQYAEVKLEGDADLIVADGDDFIPDILGLSTEGFSFSNTNGNGVFDTVYTDNIENAAGRGGPNFPLGITVSGISTLSGNVSIGGTLTYEDVTNVDSVGIVTARSGIDITSGGLDITAGGVTVTAGGINVTTGDIDVISGSIGIGTVTPANLLEIQGANGAGGLRLTETNHTNLNRHGRIFEYAGGLYFQSRNDTANGDFIFRGGLDGVEKLRIGSSSQIGIAGANYGTSGQVLTSGGASAAPQWANASGGAWEVVSTHALSGSTSYIDSNGWSNSYQQYQLVFNDVYYNNTGFKIWLRIYKDATSGNAGTLKTASSYTYGSSYQELWSGGNVVRYGYWSNYHKLRNQGNGICWNGYQTFHMQTFNGGGNVSTTWFGRTMTGGDLYDSDSGLYDADKSEFITGIRLYFFASDGTTAISPSNGRVTILRMKYS